MHAPLVTGIGMDAQYVTMGHEPKCRGLGDCVISRPIRKPTTLRKFGYQLGPFGFRPSAGGGGAHVSQRRDRKREFGDVVAERRFGKQQNVMRAGGEIDLLDFDPDFLGEGLRRFTALGGLSDIANPLVGPVERHYECRHVFLRWMNRSKTRRSRGKPMQLCVGVLEERPKSRRCY